MGKWILDQAGDEEVGRLRDKRNVWIREGVFHGAGNGVRTRDPQLGKLMLYQLSYSRSDMLELSPQAPGCQVFSRGYCSIPA